MKKKKFRIINLFANTKPLTGEYMDLLEITFKNSLSKTAYKI